MSHWARLKKSGAFVLLFALILGWGASRARSWVLLDIEENGALLPYAECGEVLLHAVDAGGKIYPSFYMPLASLTAARLFSHARPGAWPWREAALLIGLLSVGAICVLAGAPMAAIPAVLVLLAWPDLWPSHHSYVQFFYTLFILQTAAAMVWRASSPDPARTVVLAAAVGVSLLFRSPLAFLPPLLAGLECAARRQRGRKWVVNAVILLTVPYLSLLPWAAMNWLVHRQLSFFELGESFPNIVAAAGGLVHYSEEFWRAQARADPRLQSKSMMRFLSWALVEIGRHPVRYAAGFMGRLGYAVGMQPCLFALAGAGSWMHRRSPAVRALTLLCVYFLLIHCALIVIPNYMVPLWPLLAVLAAMLADPWAPRPASSSARLVAAARAWLLVMLACSGLAGAEAGARALSYARLSAARPPESDRAWSEALAQDPDDAWLLYRRGWRRLKAGDRKGTAADWIRAVELRPGNALWSLHRDWALCLAGDCNPLLSWNRALSSRVAVSNRADPDLLKAYALSHEGRDRLAREHLEAAFAGLRLQSEPGPAALSLEMLWEHAGELFGDLPPDDWLALWRELHRLSDDAELSRVAERSDPMREAVVRLQDRGAQREALALLSRLLRMRPGSAALWTDKAVIETFRGSWEAAAADLRKALAADASFVPASLTLGAVYVKRGKNAEALKVYDRALSLGSIADDPLRGALLSTREETVRALTPAPAR